MLSTRQFSKMLLVDEGALRRYESLAKIPRQIELYVLSVLQSNSLDSHRRKVLNKNRFRLEYQILKDLDMLDETWTASSLIKRLLTHYKNYELIELFTGINKDKLKNIVEGKIWRSTQQKRTDIILLMLCLSDVMQELGLLDPNKAARYRKSLRSKRGRPEKVKVPDNLVPRDTDLQKEFIKAGRVRVSKVRKPPNKSH